MKPHKKLGFRELYIDMKIKDFIGQRCITSEDGQRVYVEICPKLKAAEDVQLDFDGVTIFASPFFNFAIGQLYRDISGEVLQKHLKAENLSSNGTMILNRVIKNSKVYYENPEHRKAVDEAMKRLAEEQQ